MSLRYRSESVHVFGNIVATGRTQIVAAVAGQFVRVYRLLVTNGASANVLTLEDFDGTTNTAISQSFNLAANGSIALDIPINGDPWWVTGERSGIVNMSGLALRWNASAQPYSYDLWYLQGV